MVKRLKTRSELADLVVSEVKKLEECEGIRSVAINHIVDDSVDFTWNVSTFNPGTSGREDVGRAIRIVQEKLQDLYDCAEDT